MLMGQRRAGGGNFGVRGMVSAEPWTIGGCGYPDLLASGETCGNRSDPRSAASARHVHGAGGDLRPSAERRAAVAGLWRPCGRAGSRSGGLPPSPSAMSNPLAPISHHWLDSTHITYGVLTGGIFTFRWKAEASLFNGREPDERRTDFDFGALDSYSGRLWFLLSPAWALQVSAGHLEEGEAADHAEPASDVDRMTASATYHRRFDPDGFWATTVAWGRNAEDGDASQSLLFESSVTLHAMHVVFGRAEIERPAAGQPRVSRVRPGVHRRQAPGRGYVRTWTVEGIDARCRSQRSSVSCPTAFAEFTVAVRTRDSVSSYATARGNERTLMRTGRAMVCRVPDYARAAGGGPVGYSRVTGLSARGTPGRFEAWMARNTRSLAVAAAVRVASESGGPRCPR